MEWTGTAALPAPGKVLWGWSESRGPVVCKLVRAPDGKTFRFVDDRAMPVRDIRQWAYAVAPDETA